MINAQLTPTQRQCMERSKAFHARIAARAVSQKPALERPFAVRGQYLPALVKPAPEPAQMLPLAMPAELRPPFRPSMIWPVIPPEQQYVPMVMPSVFKIQEVVAGYYGITRNQLIGVNRTKKMMRPRHVAVYIARALTQFSTLMLGRLFGGKDHTVILNSVNRINSWIKTDDDLAFEIADLFFIITGVQQ